MHRARVSPMAIASLAALLLLLSAAPAALAGAATPLFAPSAASGDWAKVSEPNIVRSRFVDINFGILAHADGSPRVVGEGNRALQLNLFPDVSLTASLQRMEVNSPVSFSWVGTVDGVDLSQVMLVVRQGIMAGTISMPGRLYQIRYLGGDSHAVLELNPSLFPPDGEPIPVYPAPSEAAPAPGADAQPDDGSLIDVLVVYTAAARAAAGGTAAMQALIDLARTETNTSYQNSGITQRIRVVHTEEVVYTESGDIQTDLTRLQNASDGFMDNVHTLRNTHGADLVQLIVENGGGFCGIAYLMSSVSSSFASFAFGVTARTCATGNYSFGHEMGHNMGARHDWFVDSTNNSPYTYNHGYVNVGAGWRTIMAYNNACSPGFCTRLQFWSNPNVTFNGAPMGVPEGSSNAADNRKTLNNTALTVANFRAAINPLTLSSLTGSPASPQPLGTTITFTAVGSGGVAPYQYKWWLSTNGGQSYVVVQDWGPGNTFTWGPTVPGSSYMIGVWLRSAGNTNDTFEAGGTIPFTITGATLTSLTANPASPQPVFTTITFTAVASGGAAPYQYKWWLSTDGGATWFVVRDWGSGNTWTWGPTTANANAMVGVWVRSAGNTVDMFEGGGAIPFVVTARASLASLTANPPSPQPVFTTITFTAMGAGGTPPYQYKWWLSPDGGATWFVVRDWGTGNTWSWGPTAPNANAMVGVWLRSAGNPNDMFEGGGAIPFVVTP